MQNPQECHFGFFASCLLSKARQSRYNSRTSRSSLCGSHERCFCVWARERARVCVSLLKHPTAVETRNSLKNSGAIQLFLLLFIFAMLSAAVAVSVSHRKLLMLW